MYCEERELYSLLFLFFLRVGLHWKISKPVILSFVVLLFCPLVRCSRFVQFSNFSLRTAIIGMIFVDFLVVLLFFCYALIAMIFFFFFFFIATMVTRKIKPSNYDIVTFSFSFFKIFTHFKKF